MATKKKTTRSKKRTPPKKKRVATSKAVALIKKPQGSNVPATLSLANPQDIMNFGRVLKGYIEANHLSVSIQGRDYAMVDGWKFAGMNFGLTAIPGTPTPKHLPGQYVIIMYIEKEFLNKRTQEKYVKEVAIFNGFANDHDTIQHVRMENKISREVTRPYFAYECQCEVVKLSDGTRVSSGTGFCSNLEILKSGFDEYSVNSMSQTRSIGKAYRNLLGYVMNAAGIDPTPAEEMLDVEANDMEFRQGEKKKFDKNKLYPTEKAFTELLKRVLRGEPGVMEAARKHLQFTDDQEAALKVAERNAKPSHATEEKR